MHACPRCWEVLDQPDSQAAYPVQQTYAAEPSLTTTLPQQQIQAYRGYDAIAGTAPAATLTREAPPAVLGPSLGFKQRNPKRFRTGRVVTLGIVIGLLLAIGFAALEANSGRIRGTLPEQVLLVREGFPDLKFAIQVPRGWDVLNETVSGKQSVSFREPASENPSGDRSFQVSLHEASFATVRSDVEARAPSSAKDYKRISIVGGLKLDDRKALRHLYTDGDEYREAWWVQRGKGTYRIEFRSPVAKREEAALLNVRIARTFDVL